MMTGMLNKPRALPNQKLGVTLPNTEYSTNVQTRPGQKANLKCSQVLSLMAANHAMGFQQPDHSNKKCKAAPEKKIATTPSNSKFLASFSDGIGLSEKSDRSSVIMTILPDNHEVIVFFLQFIKEYSTRHHKIVNNNDVKQVFCITQ